MLSHISFSVSDLQKSSRFYDAVLGALGYKRVYSSDSAAGWGTDENNEKFAIKKRVEKAVAPSKGFHLTFHAKQQDNVHAFHAQGVRHAANKSLILVRGLGGTGKTTLSSSLSRALQFPVLNRDDVKESLRDLSFDLKLQSEIG